MAARQPARASPELRKAPLSPRYRRNYTTSRGTTLLDGCDEPEILLLPNLKSVPQALTSDRLEFFAKIWMQRSFTFHCSFGVFISIQ